MTNLARFVGLQGIWICGSKSKPHL